MRPRKYKYLGTRKTMEKGWLSPELRHCNSFSIPALPHSLFSSAPLSLYCCADFELFEIPIQQRKSPPYPHLKRNLPKSALSLTSPENSTFNSHHVLQQARKYFVPTHQSQTPSTKILIFSRQAHHPPTRPRRTTQAHTTNNKAKAPAPQTITTAAASPNSRATTHPSKAMASPSKASRVIIPRANSRCITRRSSRATPLNSSSRVTTPMTADALAAVVQVVSVQVSWLRWLVAAVWISYSRPTFGLDFWHATTLLRKFGLGLFWLVLGWLFESLCRVRTTLLRNIER